MTAGTADILRKAKALIDTPEKWVRDVFYDRYKLPGTVCHCLVGAICTAVTGNEQSMDLDHPDVVTITVNYFGGVTPEQLSEWNDYPRRTYHQVMTRLSGAIELAEAHS